MSLRQKLNREIWEFFVTTLYFALCFGVLVLLKRLYLSEYQIQVPGVSLALVSALIVAKVVLLMEHVTLGQWVRKHAVGLDVILRTILYTIGVAVALLLERGFEARHEHGGFRAGVAWVFQHREMHHVWADTIAVGAALLAFNALSAVRRHLGEGRLHRLFLAPPAQESNTGGQDNNRPIQIVKSNKQTPG
jgi:hypothetical protein